MRFLMIVMLLAGPALAEPAQRAKPSKSHKTVVQDLSDKPIVLKADPPKPQVVVVTHDGKNVTGRPKSSDRLTGLDHRLR